MPWRPRLRTILLIINVVILCLPLGGIAVLRIYESALVRQTESELIAQGAFIVAAYRAAFARITQASEGLSDLDAPYRLPTPLAGREAEAPLGRWRPRPAMLDLATDTILPPQPDPFLPSALADPLATAVGQALTPVLRDAQVVTLAGIRIVDQRGTIVASTGEELRHSMLNSEEVRRALRGEPVSVLRERLMDAPPPSLASISRGGRLRVFVATPIFYGERILGAVVLSRTPSNIGRALYGKRYLLLNLALALLLVVLLLAVFTSLTISRPIEAVIAQAQRAARGEKGAVTPLRHPVTREITQLSEAVAGMAQTLEQRADYIRAFASHVSHEFKTPLTAIQGAVELLRDHFASMSAAERERFLDNLHADAGRLERLVRRLLELARADVMTLGEETACVGEVIERVRTRYERLGMQIAVAQDPSLPEVAMAEETLDSILANLMDNAHQHGGHAVSLRIDTGYDEQAGAHVVITLGDNGPGISAANAKWVFEPFFTTSRPQGGTGLGLAVVKSLLLAHQGSIELLPSASGAVFRVHLVAAG